MFIMKKSSLLLLLSIAANMIFAQLIVPTAPANKNVILEQFTGIKSFFCPLGHLYANQCAEQNPDRFWAVNIHAGYWMSTTYPHFGTDDGTIIYDGFNIGNYPAGALNRSHGSTGNETILLNSNAWLDTVTSMLSQSSPVNLAGIAMIDENTRMLTIYVEAYYTADASNSTNYLTIALLQNNILASQNGSSLNPTQMIDGEYNHMHVLRDIITPTWGDAIIATTQGSLWQNSYQYEIKETIGNAPYGVAVILEDLELLVWVTDGERFFVHTAAKIELVDPADFPSFPEIAVRQEEGTLNVDISWIAPNLSKSAAALDGYNLYRDGVKLNSSLLPASQTTYTDVAPQFGYSYCYKITPVVNGAESYPDTDCVFMDFDLPPVENVTAQQIELNQKEILVTWEKPDVDFEVTGYNLYRDNQIVNSELITETSFINLGSLFNKEYCFTVEAIQGALVAEKSEADCVTLKDGAAAPTNLKATQLIVNEPTLNLTWNAAAGANGYDIYRDEIKINDKIVTAWSYQDEAPEFDVEYCYTVRGVFEGLEGPESDKACVTAIKGGSIDNTLETAVNIYPNPVTSTLYLDTELNVTEYQIFDLQGRLIYSSKTGAKEVSTSEWASGVYVMKITTDKGTVNKQFVKQ